MTYKVLPTSLFTAVLLFCLSSSLLAQNIMISDFDDPQEPCIVMDPNRPNVVMVGSNLDFVYVSTDTGRTWTGETLQSAYGVWGDPVLVVDTAGDFYYFHLSNPASGNWIDRIVCQKTTNDGGVWSPGTFTGLNGTKAQDKEWVVVDRTNNYMYVTWTQFDAYDSQLPGDSSIILFSRSEDAGQTWSNPLRLNTIAGDCVDSDNTVEGASPAIGPNGEVYVAWAGPEGLLFNRSLDNGDTWLSEEIFIDSMPYGWDHIISGLSRANGLPVLTTDLSGGDHHGTMYINWTDQRNGPGDTDVWLSKSTDGGDTWSAPIRVNDDAPGKEQFFSWMTVDQATGYLYFVFYDRRNHTDDATDVYLAYSKDGGATFVNEKISELPFVPTATAFMGDYNNITAHNGIVRPVWTRMDTGSNSIWTHIYTMPEDSVVGVDEVAGSQVFELEQNYPNPTGSNTYISFKLHEDVTVDLGLYNIYGQEIYKAIDGETLGYGKHTVSIDIKALGLSQGVYFYKLTVDNKTKTKRLSIQY